MTRPTVPARLRRLARLYAQRHRVYGSTDKTFGRAVAAMVPLPIVLRTAADLDRFALFAHCVDKLSRYGRSFARGGHPDSLDDVAVYAMMLAERDDEVRRKKP